MVTLISSTGNSSIVMEKPINTYWDWERYIVHKWNMPRKYKEGISKVETEMNIQQNSQIFKCSVWWFWGKYFKEKFSMVIILQIYKFLPIRSRKLSIQKWLLLLIQPFLKCCTSKYHLNFYLNFSLKQGRKYWYSPDPLPSMSISMFWDILLFREEKRMNSNLSASEGCKNKRTSGTFH